VHGEIGPAAVRSSGDREAHVRRTSWGNRARGVGQLGGKHVVPHAYCEMVWVVMDGCISVVREPDAQLGFLWGGLTMGMLLCIPLILAGIAVLGFALTRQPIAEHG